MIKAAGWHYCALLFSISIMLTGLFLSRAMLSSGIILFFIVTVLSLPSLKSANTYFKDPYNILLALLFIIPLASGLWSADTSEWWKRMVVKLPMVVLPFAFTFFSFQKKRHYNLLSALYILLVVAGCAWSMYYYLNDFSAIHEGYLRAKVIATWFEDDHVRFSLAVVIAILLLYCNKGWFGEKSRLHNSSVVIKCVLIPALIIYLHILGAKTGLICLYLSTFIILISRIIRSKSWLKSGLLLLLFLSIPVLAYFLLPTFHNRVHYILYDFRNYSSGNFEGGFPDGARILSLKGGLNILQQNFFGGIGYGDVWPAMLHWYDLNYPQIPIHDRLFPSNQWLIYGCVAGVGAMFIFTIAVITPFFMNKFTRNAGWRCFHACSIFCFLTEMNLEGQHGVFLYCFFAMWFKYEATGIIKSETIITE